MLTETARDQQIRERSADGGAQEASEGRKDFLKKHHAATSTRCVLSSS